jgi:chorismate--pyruvate lyase
MRTLKLTRIDAWRMKPPSHPDPLHPWLTDRGSLTARLIAQAGNFSLRRIAQRRALPLRDEVRHLGFKRGEFAVVREVLLYTRGKPRVFAHSVAHLRDLRGAWRGLSRLGTQPLAEMLFHDPTVRRLPMEYRKLDARHPLVRRAAECLALPRGALWARRSVFLKRGRPLLVTELFLKDPTHD